ncbi:MAG: serine/threonine protein kinase [Mastigocoleus sp.]
MNLIHKTGDIIAINYQLSHVLGQGGMGITYAAKDLRTNQLVALKILSLQRVNDWKVIELFEREAKILASLNNPGIPEYIDYFQIETEEDKTFVIVQQLAPGNSLFNLINQGWKPTIKQVKIIATKILEILVYLQNLTPAVIHRDIKPQNIICQKDGTVFLVDFGAVQDTYHNTVTGGSTIVGTFGYMAPEQFRGQAVLSTDLYGLGTTLLFLLTGESPADLPQKKLKIDFKSTLSLPKAFADWLDRMIEPIGEMRFTSAEEALSVLKENQALPPKSKLIQRPKYTKIKLKQNDTSLTIDIPPTLLNNNQSLFSGLFPLFPIVLILGIFHAWFFEFIASDIFPGREIPFFCFFALILTLVIGIPLLRHSANSLLFSSAFRQKIKIVFKGTPKKKSFDDQSQEQLVTTHTWVVRKKCQLAWMNEEWNLVDASFPVQIYLENQKILFINQKLSFILRFCRIKIGSKELKFGTFLTQTERIWLVDEINAFIEKYKNN